MCHCKRNKVYPEPTHQRGSSGLVQRATEQGTESSLRDNRMHATQNLQLNSAVRLNRLDALRENFLQFFLSYIYLHVFVSVRFRLLPTRVAWLIIGNI